MMWQSRTTGFEIGTKAALVLTVMFTLTATLRAGDSERTDGDVTLVRDGEPRAVIILPPEPHPAVTQAGSEIVKHVELMTGVELPVLIESEQAGEYLLVRIERARPTDERVVDIADFDDHLPIRIGEAADDELDELIWTHVNASDGYALIVSEDGIQMRGLTRLGSQHAAFDLLQQLGVRWHDPIEEVRIVPERDTVTLPVQRTFAAPSNELRMMPPVQPRSTVYTMRMKRDHLERVKRSPYVTPTPTADENFVIAQSHGWAGAPEPFHAANHVPPILDRDGEYVVPPVIEPNNLYGYMITDPEAEGPKVNIVLTDGNHAEYTGSWSFHGTVEFLLSDEPEAAALRRHAEVYVYPMVNPDGRTIFSRVRNPEVAAAGWANHNRAWDTAGLFSTIDALTAAMRYDTRGEAEYLLDYHTGPRAIYSPPALMDSPLVRAMRQRVDFGPSRSQIRGTTQQWALRDEGLAAPYAFTPEHSPWEPLDGCLSIGRAYGLSLHDAVLGIVEADPDAPPAEPTAPRRRWTQGQPTNLLEAAEHGDVEAMQRHLEDEADVNATNLTGTAPLHMVAEDGHVGIALALIERGADVTLANHRGWTPLHYAARNGHADLATLLIDHGANVNAVHLDGDTPLHLAASFGRAAVARTLIEHGAEVEAVGRWQRTPGQWARRLGHAEVVELLDVAAQTE